MAAIVFYEGVRYALASYVHTNDLLLTKLTKGTSCIGCMGFGDTKQKKVAFFFWGRIPDLGASDKLFKKYLRLGLNCGNAIKTSPQFVHF